jgi:hypothetical protein
MAVGHPFLAVGGIPGALQAPKTNQTHGAEKKSYYHWKVPEWCHLRRRKATVRLLCDAFFLTARLRHSENFNEKLKLALRCETKELLQYCGNRSAARPPTEITKKRAATAS